MPHRPSNVDNRELDKFESAGSGWWDRRGEFQALHDINPLRIRYIEDRCGLAGKRVLDVGCGGGILSEAMARRGAEVTGIDMGQKSLEVARRHMKQTGVRIDYRHISVEQLAKRQPESFDVVTCLELLEHVPAPGSVVDACSRLVSPGGHVVFATLNRNPLSYLLAIGIAEYVLGIIRPGTHQYRKFIKPGELKNWAHDAGLIFRELTGMLYLPLIRKSRLIRSAAVNYFMHVQRPG